MGDSLTPRAMIELYLYTTPAGQTTWLDVGAIVRVSPQGLRCVVEYAVGAEARTLQVDESKDEVMAKMRRAYEVLEDA